MLYFLVVTMFDPDGGIASMPTVHQGGIERLTARDAMVVFVGNHADDLRAARPDCKIIVSYGANDAMIEMDGKKFLTFQLARNFATPR